MTTDATLPRCSDDCHSRTRTNHDRWLTLEDDTAVVMEVVVDAGCWGEIGPQHDGDVSILDFRDFVASHNWRNPEQMQFFSIVISEIVQRSIDASKAAEVVAGNPSRGA